MKLAKLSLAAVVAAGSFSLANAAVNLEEAIKDVEVSGMLRYRMDGKRVKDKTANKVTSDSNVNKYRVDLNSKIKFDDYFTGNFGVRFLANDGNDNGPALNGQSVGNAYELVEDQGKYKLEGESASNVAIRDINLVYHNSDFGTTVKAGRQGLYSLYTNGVLADGIVVSNESVEGLKVSAFYVANMDNDTMSIEDVVNKDGEEVKVYANPAYGLGVEGSFDVVDFGLWAVQSKNVATLYGLDLGAGIDMDDAKLAVKAQVSQTSIDSKLDKDTYKNSTNYNLNVGFDMGVFNAKVGYASAGNKEGKSTTAIQDSGAFDYVGEILMNFDKTDGQNQFIYASLGTKVDAFSAAFEYVNGNNKLETRKDDMKGNEYVARLGYAYSEKLNFSGYYAMAEVKTGDAKVETNKFRIEAKYKF